MDDRRALIGTNRRPGVFLMCALAGAVGVAALAGTSSLSPDQIRLLIPTLATFAAFAVFTVLLAKRVRTNIFGELGFVYLAYAVAYTAVPAISLMALDLDSYQSKFSRLLPTTAQVSLHLWRHALFVVGVGAGYLLFRGRSPTVRRDGAGEGGTQSGSEHGLILFLVGVILVCGATERLLSAPVTEYVEFYTRFSDLSGISLWLAYVVITLRTGANFALLTLLFCNFRRYRWLAVSCIVLICSYEIAYSLGSRIQALVILMGAACLYHHKVKIVGIRQGALALIAITALFTAVELFRSADFDVTTAQDTVATTGARPAAEFSAVFFTGYHLYSERAEGSLAPTEWPMFVTALVALIPFVDHVRWHPMWWYAEHYFPDAVVPPETMGPIAESAIWGGETDLIIRSLVNGAFFALIVRWYVSRRSKWWALFIYAYCYATCALTLKNSVFIHLVFIERTLLPTILVVEVARRWMIRRPSAAPVPMHADT